MPVKYLKSDMFYFSIPHYQNQEGFLYDVVEQEEKRLLFRYRDRNLRIEREYVFQNETYEFKHAVKIWYGDASTKGDVYIGLSEGFPEGQSTNILLAPYQDVRNFIYHTQEDTEREKLQSLSENKEIKQVVQWGGIENRYFVSALVNRSNLKPYVYLSKPLPGMGMIDLQFPFYKEPGKDYFESFLSIYMGPKVVEKLQAVEASFDEAVDFGIFSVICIPLLKTMNFFYRFCRNYGIAIILLTLLIRLLFHPLTKKSLQSMREMQRIQPQIAKIKEKFKEDREKMNKEVMELMRANKVNPLGGCLPLLFQMPIFFALYRVLYNAIELYQAPFFWWIQDLSQKDPYFVLPVIMGIFMFLQQKLTPTATIDPAQQKMMMIMPVIFSFFMIALPSGLVLYILFSTAIQVASQVMVNREFAKKGL